MGRGSGSNGSAGGTVGAVVQVVLPMVSLVPGAWGNPGTDRAITSVPPDDVFWGDPVVVTGHGCFGGRES